MVKHTMSDSQKNAIIMNHKKKQSIPLNLKYQRTWTSRGCVSFYRFGSQKPCEVANIYLFILK